MAPMAVGKVAFGPFGELRESGRRVPFNKGRVVEHRHVVKLKLCKCPETFRRGCTITNFSVQLPRFVRGNQY